MFPFTLVQKLNNINVIFINCQKGMMIVIVSLTQMPLSDIIPLHRQCSPKNMKCHNKNSKP